MIIAGPSGIGDLSWMYSKLCHVGEMDYEVADGWPYRSHDYMMMLPNVKSVRYGEFVYEDILAFEQTALRGKTTWKDIEEMGAMRVFMQPNHHLERGRPLADWLPDLPTDYHYPMKIAPEDVEKARALVEGFPVGEAIGISCASYRGAKAWQTWGSDEWSSLCLDLSFNMLTPLIFLGGRWDDLTDAVAGRFDGPSAPVLNLVGKTSFGVVCALHLMIPWYIGFSSGLGVIRTVLRRPTLMLWPDHQAALSTSWADPEDLDSSRYKASPYAPVKDVCNLFIRQVREVLDGK